MMQEDSFPAAERILADIDSVFKKDPKLAEFDIVPVTENQNKSPVIHINHSLGLESWCVRHMYCHIYHRLMELRSKRSREDPAVMIRLLHGALLINPDTATFWNMSKELVEKERLTPEAELHFTAVVLTRKAKCAEALNQRKWLLNFMLFKQRSLKSPEEVETALGRELQVAEAAASRYPNNYHAWNHRMWAVSLLGRHCLNEGTIFAAEWRSSGIWIMSHVSDHSGLQYRQFVLQRIFSLQIEQLVQPVEEWKNAMEYLVNGLAFPSCWGSQECLSHKLGLVVADLRLNCELILQFEGHEALWCHRRFLLFLVLRLARASTCLCASNVISSLGRLEQGLVHTCVTRRTDNPHQARFAHQHLKWLSCVLKLELPDEG